VHVRARKPLRKKDGAKFAAIHNPKVGGSIPPVAAKNPNATIFMMSQPTGIDVNSHGKQVLIQKRF
jgi:hypothetical protein